MENKLQNGNEKNFGKLANNAKRGLLKSAENLEIPISSGYSKAQMGSQEYKEILANLRSLKDIELKQGKDFLSMKERLQYFGRLDYDMVKATVFRENWETALEESGINNFENYKLLESKLKRIKNPKNFYELIKKSDVAMDLFLYYKQRRRISIWRI